MNRKMKSLLGGAAVAAFLIAPTVPGFSQTNSPQVVIAVNGPPAPPAPSMPHMPSPPPMPPAPPAHGGWMTAPTRTFNTTSVKLEDVVGTVNVKVRDSGPMTLEVA